MSNWRLPAGHGRRNDKALAPRTHVCPCGRPFAPHQHGDGHVERIYCSLTCRNLANNPLRRSA
jgi:hypothetical protein